jgi:error-prone DNA polymerase
VQDLARRTGLGRDVLARLAAAGAFGSLGLDARRALWEVEALRDDAAMPLFAGIDFPEPPAPLPEMRPIERVAADYEATGLSLERHPVHFLRDDLARQGAVPAARLRAMKNGEAVTVGGLVTVRQRPQTAKGIVFMTIEDETGYANAIIRPRTYERQFAACLESTFVVVDGTIERAGEVIHVLARDVRSLRIGREVAFGGLSRDFR